jgi:hypothetical protein
MDVAGKAKQCSWFREWHDLDLDQCCLMELPAMMEKFYNLHCPI